VIFAGGLLGLARFLPAGALLGAGLWPFLPGDVLKSALAAGLFPSVWRLVGEARSVR
jgi:biotin transport system substrate-specific component